MAWNPFMRVVSKSNISDEPQENPTVLEHSKCTAKADEETFPVLKN